MKFSLLLGYCIQYFNKTGLNDFFRLAHTRHIQQTYKFIINDILNAFF